ncbi:MucR family transcriptional regulator [Geodermatophilus marinus]|uniref:MucR family transcriptional regulator n=1 Tax=Geodermatophilus sp. LHW52908 TaxID=2303986 RepID=UPI000E3CA82F|nr:MucR family transcriptional regulator [Geodermatophilus sp. LHW52908]RFU22193.1 MucR family transcriptional regulator [Geodermatophilus sp. LHW52908]
MLHPVGPLPTGVYWRRRLLVLTLPVALLGGGGWLTVAAATGDDEGTRTVEAAETAAAPSAPPALERVVPSLTGVQPPTEPSVPALAPAPEPAAPQPGGPCSDEMIGLEVRGPGSAPSGERATFELVVTNASAVPCVRPLDKGLQEIVLLDGAGNRVWGSNDCLPEAGEDTRTLAPGESAAFPLVWGGLSSEPGCGAERLPLPPGDYALRGRLDTATSPDTPFTVT